MSSSQPVRLAVFTLERMEWACAQVRVLHPLRFCVGRVEPLWGAVWDGERFLADAGVIDRADVLLFQRTFAAGKGGPIVDKALASGKPVLLDLDDNLFDIPDTPYFRRRMAFDPGEIAALVRRVGSVSVATGELADRVGQIGAKDVRVLANLVLESAWPRAGAVAKRPGPVRIGFVGSPTHEQDLALVEEALIEVAQRHGADVEFVFFGCVTRGLRGLPGMRLQQFDEGYLSFARTLSTMGLDVAVAPLVDNPFNRCKSNIKWLEYAMAGVAGVYSDLPPYSADVVEGETGLLASTPQQWADALERLITEPQLRAHVAQTARATALARYSMTRRAGEYERFWTEFV